MKALFISPAAAVYGSERSMLSLLRSRCFDAEVVCPVGGDLERELRGINVKVHPQVFGTYSFRENPFWHLNFFFSFQRILQECKPDVVVINLDGNTPLVTLSAVWAGVPIIRFSRFEFFPPTRNVDRWCWRKVKAVVCPSNWVRQQVLKWAGASYATRTHRFYDSYDASNVPSTHAEAILKEFCQDGESIIGCIGRMHRGKKFETAIEALAIIRSAGKNARLLIIGGDDGSPQAHAYADDLKSLADKLGVKGAISFTGYLPHAVVSDVFSLMATLVLSSESESFGMVLMEAWAHKVPTVCTDTGGCGEITRVSGGGLLAPVGDARLFATQILHLLDDPEKAANIGRSGHDWVINNCNPDAYATRFSMLLNEISNGTWNEPNC